MSRFSISQKKRIGAIARRHGLQFVRIFGSGARSLERARDIDLVVDGKSLAFSDFSELVGQFEAIFNKPVDLVRLHSDLSPVLIQEIARESVPLWEELRSGRIAYASLIDRLHAVAADEMLSYPQELRAESIRAVQRRLRVA